MEVQELHLDNVLKFTKNSPKWRVFLLHSFSENLSMESKIIANGILRSIASLIGIALLLLFLYEIQSVIIYLIISLILTLIINPLLEFFKNRLKFKNNLAVVCTMLILILFFVGFIMMFVPLIISQIESLSLLNTQSIEKNITDLTSQFEAYLTNHNIDSAQLLKDSKLTSKLNFNFIPNFLNSVLGTLSSFGMGLGSTLFITFFFLKDKLIFLEGLKKIIPDNHEEKILNSLNKTNHMLSRYFIGLLIQLSVVFVSYIIVLLIFGVTNAFVIALLCAILNIIPYIGPLIGSIVAAVLTMIGNLNGDFQNDIIPTTLYVMLGFWIVQIIDNNVSQPIIFSKSVNSHPLEIFLITLIAGFLFGIMGMIIAIPFYTMLKIISKEFFAENKIVKIITKDL